MNRSLVIYCIYCTNNMLLSIGPNSTNNSLNMLSIIEYIGSIDYHFKGEHIFSCLFSANYLPTWVVNTGLDHLVNGEAIRCHLVPQVGIHFRS